MPSVERFLDEKLREIVAEIWQALLGVEVSVCDSANSLSRAHVVGFIEIGWDPALLIAVCMPQELLVELSVQLFEAEAGSTEAMQHSLIQEIANMTAGNLKTALPGQTSLSLPGVKILSVEELHELERASAVARQFEAESGMFSIMIQKREQGVRGDSFQGFNESFR